MISNADCDDKDTSTNNNRSTGVVDLHEIVTNSMRQKKSFIPRVRAHCVDSDSMRGPLGLFLYLRKSGIRFVLHVLSLEGQRAPEATYLKSPPCAVGQTGQNIPGALY